MRAADGRSTSYSSPAVRRGLVRYVPRLSLGREARYVRIPSGSSGPRAGAIWVPPIGTLRTVLYCARVSARRRTEVGTGWGSLWVVTQMGVPIVVRASMADRNFDAARRNPTRSNDG